MKRIYLDLLDLRCLTMRILKARYPAGFLLLYMLYMSEFISGEEVKKLALLARIEISAAEVKKLQKELGAILGYVSQLKEAPPREVKSSDFSENQFPKIANIFAEDKPVEDKSEVKKGEHIRVKHIL